MRFALPTSSLLCWKLLAVSGLLMAAAWGCSSATTSSSGSDCDGDEDCRDSQVCAAGRCENVCWNVTVGDGTDGALCRQITDCESLQCDYSSRVTSTCQCYSCPGIGGTVENPVIWEEVYTCIDTDNECFGERVPATFAVTEISSSETRAVITAGLDLGFEISGYETSADSAYLCETQFKWEEQDADGEPERGCWTFNSDQTVFYKHSFRPLGLVDEEFKCVGVASRGEGTTPPQVMTCEQLASQADERDFRHCPEAPP